MIGFKAKNQKNEFFADWKTLRLQKLGHKFRQKYTEFGEFLMTIIKVKKWQIQKECFDMLVATT